MSEGGLSPERFQQDMREARREFDIVQANDTTLLVDLDTAEAVAQFDRVLPKVRREFDVQSVEQWPSKSGNTHARVTLGAPLPFAERIALQAALGSDGVREVLAIKRMRNGCIEPSVLFRPRAKAEAEAW